MAKHTTYRGVSIDMDSMRRENEKVPALGNMRVNARGDKLGNGGTVTKTADQMARENHRVQATVMKTGLKGPLPDAPVVEQKSANSTPVKATVKKVKETELPNGDITIEGDSDAS